MFEQTDDSVDKTRSRVIMGLAGVGVALLVGAILLFGSFDSTPPEAPTPPPGIPNAKHAGDPEFEKYNGLVAIVNKKFFTQANMLGQRQAVCTGTIANFTDKTITGIELRGNVYGTGGKVMATTLAMPVPRRYESISPKGRIDFAITIDGVPREGEIEDITVELEGLAVAE